MLFEVAVHSTMSLSCSDDFFGGEIHGDLSGGEMIVAQEMWESRERDALLDRGDGNGMTTHARRDRAADTGTVGDFREQALDDTRSYRV